MQKVEFRTYKRREVTRKSGFKASGERTGGECKIKKTERVDINKGLHFEITKDKLNTVELFNKNLSVFAFGGYAFSNLKIDLSVKFEFLYEGKRYFENKTFFLMDNTWNPFGIYLKIDLNADDFIENLNISIDAKCADGFIDFYGLNYDVVDYDYFVREDVYQTFFTKTNINVPYIFYFQKENILSDIVDNIKEYQVKEGIPIVLKSCNRCKRFLPINKDNEINTLAFSLHCVKRSPCKHSTFSNYRILESDYDEKYKTGNSFKSFYGHQLECKSCKKFYVNAPLNPLRNPQQHKEDGLRRRAFEDLVNNLLNQNIIHFEFKRKKNKEFTEYIWNKFDKKCFKCGKELSLKEMNLDHTRPLAYLYPLDETATCLCNSHNSSKNDHFPSEFYSQDEIQKLSQITGLTIKQLNERKVNQPIVELLIEKVEWFFDEFLMTPDYQKIRDGRLTADKIYSALLKVLPKDVDLIALYIKKKGKKPSSITIN